MAQLGAIFVVFLVLCAIVVFGGSFVWICCFSDKTGPILRTGRLKVNSKNQHSTYEGKAGDDCESGGWDEAGEDDCGGAGGEDACSGVGGGDDCGGAGGEDVCSGVGEDDCGGAGGEDACSEVGGGEDCGDVE